MIRRPALDGRGRYRSENSRHRPSATRRPSLRRSFPPTLIRPASGRELREEAHVIVVEHPNVRDAVSQHRDALDANTEGEARVPLAVVADMLEHVGIDHAGAEDLHPPVTPRDVNLDAWLSKREKARAQE
jgi:hypothetical protein